MTDKEKTTAQNGQSFGPVSRIVASYAQRNDVSQDDIVALTHRLLPVFGSEASTVAAADIVGEMQIAKPKPTPAIPIAKAVTDEKVYCLCCGKGFTMLKRHLKAEHGLTEDEYRAMFDLPDDFPLVAPKYSERKAAYAKEVGLGKYSRDVEGDQGVPAR